MVVGMIISLLVIAMVTVWYTIHRKNSLHSKALETYLSKAGISAYTFNIAQEFTSQENKRLAEWLFSPNTLLSVFFG